MGHNSSLWPNLPPHSNKFNGIRSLILTIVLSIYMKTNTNIKIIRNLFLLLEYITTLTIVLIVNSFIMLFNFIMSLRSNQSNQFIVILSMFTIAIWTIIYLQVPAYAQTEVNFPPHQTEEQLYESSLMEAAITYASLEFNVPRHLLVGIAHAESSYGKNFYNPADATCNNWWGIKGGPERSGSYIRCFDDAMAGARTVAKTLRLYYLDEGRLTTEEICQKWVGSVHAPKHCPNWISTVNSFNK